MLSKHTRAVEKNHKIPESVLVVIHTPDLEVLLIERADHPAALPVFVVSRVADSAMVTEVETWSVRVSGWNAETARALSPLAEIVAVPDTAFDGAALLVSVSGASSLEKIRTALIEAGASVRSQALVGSHATRYTVAPNGATRP